jgi:serine/threonine-protein kinase RsbW
LTDAPQTRRAGFSLAAGDIQTAVAWIASEARALGATERQSFGAQLCAEELLVNAMNHGGRELLAVAIALDRLPDRLRLRLEDDGAAFDLLDAPERRSDPSLSQSRPGGWGVSLVRRFADRIECNRLEDANVVVLEFIEGAEP